MAPNRLSISALLSSPPRTPPAQPTSAALPTFASASGGVGVQRVERPGSERRDGEDFQRHPTYYGGDYSHSSHSQLHPQLPPLPPLQTYAPLRPSSGPSSNSGPYYSPYDEYQLGQKRKRDEEDELAREREREMTSRYPYSASRTSLDDFPHGPLSGGVPPSQGHASLYSQSTSPYMYTPHAYPPSASPIDVRLSDGYFPAPSPVQGPPSGLYVPHHVPPSSIAHSHDPNGRTHPQYMPPPDYFPRPPPFAQSEYSFSSRTPIDHGPLTNYFPRPPSGDHAGSYILPPPQRSPHLHSPTHLPTHVSQQHSQSSYPQPRSTSQPMPMHAELPLRVETHTLSLSPSSSYSYSMSDVRHEPRAPSREPVMDRRSSGKAPSPSSWSGDYDRKRTMVSPYAPHPSSGPVSPMSDRRDRTSEHVTRKERYDPRKDEGEVVVREAEMPVLELPPAVVALNSPPPRTIDSFAPTSAVPDELGYRPSHARIPSVTLEIPPSTPQTSPPATASPLEYRPVSAQTEASLPSTITMPLSPELSIDLSGQTYDHETEFRGPQILGVPAPVTSSPVEQRPISERSISLPTTITASPRDPTPISASAVSAPQAIPSAYLPEPERAGMLTDTVLSDHPEVLSAVEQTSEDHPTSTQSFLEVSRAMVPEAYEASDQGRVVGVSEQVVEESSMGVDVKAEPEFFPVARSTLRVVSDQVADIAMVDSVEYRSQVEEGARGASPISQSIHVETTLSPPQEVEVRELKPEPSASGLRVDTVSAMEERPPTSEPVSASLPPKIEPSLEPATPVSVTHPRGKSVSIAVDDDLGRSESPAGGKKSKGKAGKGKGKGSKAAASAAKAKSKASAAKEKGTPKPDKKGSEEVPSRSRAKASKAKSPVAADEVPAEDSKKGHITEDDEEKDDRLYCICLTPYDEEMTMIGCDRCDNWYHPSCVGLDEDVELIDKFFCPPCVEGDPSLGTTHKKPCARSPYCTAPARLPLSKYCSDECGQAQVSELLKRQPKAIQRLIKLTVRGAIRPEGKVDMASGRVEMRNSGEAAQLEVLEESLRLVLEERAGSEQRLESWERRERVVEAIVGEWREEGKAKGICGYDERLGWDQSELDAASVNVAWEICQESTKCDRHRGWQVVHMDGVQRAKALEMENLQDLTTRERALRREMEIVEARRRDVQRVWREKPHVNGVEVIDVKIEV